MNVLKFFNTISKKPLIINNKPVTAQIEPTSECNLKCRMCIREAMKIPFGTMSFENFKRILGKLDSLFKINISGNGELFLNPEIFDMIRYANRRGILINISSNGTILTKDIISKICENDIGEIGISVDSTNKEKYEKIRIGANFDKLLENMKNLSNELKRKKRHTILTMAPIIFKENIDELPRFIELANMLGIKKVAFQTLQTKESFLESYDSEMKKQLVASNIQKLKEKMKEAVKLADKYNITVIFDEEESPGCIWPWRGIYVAWNGEVTICCKIPDWKKFGMGNILKQDFWEVWNGKRYQEVRRMLKKRKSLLMCKGCNRV